MPSGPRPAPPDDTCRLIFTGTTQGHPWANIQWLKITQSSRSQTDLNAVLATVLASYGLKFKTHWNPNTIVSQLTGIWKTPSGGEIVGSAGTSVAGTAGGATVADAAATYVLSWHLNAYYRGGHPRQYLPGPTVTVVTNGSDVSGAEQTALQADALAYLNAVNAATSGGITGVALGTVSFASGNAWRSPPIFRPFTGVSVSPKIGTQRRRIGR